jgi:hypothetical protein
MTLQKPNLETAILDFGFATLLWTTNKFYSSVGTTTCQPVWPLKSNLAVLAHGNASGSIFLG